MGSAHPTKLRVFAEELNSIYCLSNEQEGSAIISQNMTKNYCRVRHAHRNENISGLFMVRTAHPTGWLKEILFLQIGRAGIARLLYKY